MAAKTLEHASTRNQNRLTHHQKWQWMSGVSFWLLIFIGLPFLIYFLYFYWLSSYQIYFLVGLGGMILLCFINTGIFLAHSLDLFARKSSTYIRLQSRDPRPPLPKKQP